MERKQQSNEQVVAEQNAVQPREERPERHLKLRIETLEHRVAPNAVWGE